MQQVGFKSTKLSNSFFYRIGPNEEFFNAIRLELMLRNKWTRVGILSSVGTFSSVSSQLRTLCVTKQLFQRQDKAPKYHRKDKISQKRLKPIS